MSTHLNERQVAALLAPINPRRVFSLDGQSHLAAYDVRAHLNRIFGFGEWSADTTELTMLYEQSKVDGSTTRWRAAYRATVQLNVLYGTTYTETATGTNFGWLPDSKRADAHDMAIKTAASQALKRCAMNLGDQFGLSLYNKGSLKPVVMASLAYEATTPADDLDTPAVEGDDSHPEEMGDYS